MGRHKIDYGIDLGTTNSAIARMENGKIKVIKSDDGQMDTTPSCVYFGKNKTIFVGLKAYNQLGNDSTKAFLAFSRTGKMSDHVNTFAAFKREMGTDTLHCSPHMGKSYTPEELSAEVLKKLKSYVRDEEVNASVITIPMEFEPFKVDATRRAANLAGFQYIETLQEPIAASIAYGLESKQTQGYWLVFDLGGGTFDAALIRVVDGIMKIVDTAGDTRLGGRDIDYAIVDRIILNHLAEEYNMVKTLGEAKGYSFFRNALKGLAEEAKIWLSKNQDYSIVSDEPIGYDDDKREIEIDIKISLDDYRQVTGPIYQRAIDLTKQLTERNNLNINDLQTIILVGGPTYSQTLRGMLQDQLGHIDFSVDPMTVVAQGAALYASTRDIPLTFQTRDKAKIQLTLKYPETTVELEENLGIKIERSQTMGNVPLKIFAEVTRNDKAWSSGTIEIQGDAEIIPLPLNAGEANSFTIALFDENRNTFSCEPSGITIIQGTKPAPQIIPQTFCIEIALTEEGKQRLMYLKGLEKNQSLPAKGKSPSLKTQIDIRPGNPQDIIRIPIYAGVHNTRAIYNNWAGTVVITGEDFDKFLPKGSDVEITLYVDSTQRIRVATYFPYTDETINRELETWKQEKFDTDEIERDLSNAGNKLAELVENKHQIGNEEKIDKLRKEANELAAIFEYGRGNDDDERKVKERLRNVWKDLERLEEETELPKAKEKLTEAVESLRVTNHRYGNQETCRIVDEMEKKAKSAMNEKDPRIVEQITDDIRGFEFAILMEDMGFLVGFIKHYDDNFSTIGWRNSIEAKKLINEAKKLIASDPSKPGLQNILAQIFSLLPEGTKPYVEVISRDILAYR